MAETLGIVACILQLVDTALKAREYTLDFFHAPLEQKTLVSEMRDLHALLDELHIRIAHNRISRSSSMLQQMERPLGEFKLTMQGCTKKLQPAAGSVSKVSKRLTWTLWEKKEAKEYLVKFEQFKSLLNLWLSMNIWDMEQEHHGVVLQSVESMQRTIGDTLSEQQRQMDTNHNAVLGSVDNVAALISRQQGTLTGITEMISEQVDSEERTNIIKWLAPPPLNFFLRQAAVSSARQPGTGEWLLADPRFQKWKSGSGETLWCHGIPGAGKTILASLVVDHLNAESLSTNTGVACIYLDHKETDRIQSPTNLLAHLWKQLVLGRQIPSKVEKMYRQLSEKGTTPSLDEIEEVLFSLVAEFQKVYIVVDGLDEYPEIQRQILLTRLVTRRPTININLLTTARPHIAHDLLLPHTETLEIIANSDDVRRYVEEQIKISPRLLRHVRQQPALQGEIELKICSTMHGMFLLAKLHMDSLRCERSIEAVRAALKNLPKDLSDTYDDAMKRIESQDQEDREMAHSTLMWVMHAQRPLEVPELQTAFAIADTANQLGKDSSTIDIEILLSVCAGLVVVDGHSSVVRLVHYTAQEYLNSIQSQKFPHAQTEIALSLLTYLKFTNCAALSGSKKKLPVLLSYCQYSLVHAEGKPEGPLRDLIIDFLEQAATFRKCTFLVWHSAPWNFLDWPKEPSPLWVAAAANLVETAEFLVQQETSLPQLSGTESTPLQVACYYGHLSMVQLLIEHTAINVKAGRYGSALQAASVEGHENVVRILVENGADVNAPGGRYESALQAAASEGHESIVQFLVKNGADVNAVGGRYGSTIQAASLQDNQEMVHFLLENGANVNAEGGRYGSALQAASGQGHKALIQLLIDSGADVNALGGRYGSALQAAALLGDESVVRLLLDNGAMVNVPAEKYGSALQAAALQGKEGAVRLLLERGADVNARGGDFGSALFTASIRGYTYVVWLLLKHKVEVNAHGNKKYHNALQAASFEGHEDIARMLLSNGADANAEGGEYGSALQAASFQGHENIVQLLLDSGANVNTQGGEYGNALQAAALSNCTNTVHLLLDRGADISAQNVGYYGDALQAASLRGHESMVRLLLKNGAKVNAQGGNHGSPLQAALVGRHERLVQILIENGAHIARGATNKGTEEDLIPANQLVGFLVIQPRITENWKSEIRCQWQSRNKQKEDGTSFERGANMSSVPADGPGVIYPKRQHGISDVGGFAAAIQLKQAQTRYMWVDVVDNKQREGDS
ncbi:ankyrin repeat-containing domain protein [Mycena latifolia]|nr:ankyrin repeat-containing domain protein [Mycena latifolia]